MADKTYADLTAASATTDATLFAQWDPAGPGPLKKIQASLVRLYMLATLGTAALKDIGTSGTKVPLLDGANTWGAAQTFTLAPVFTDQTGTRAALSLGSAALKNTGTVGDAVALVGNPNSWGDTQTMPDVVIGPGGSLTPSNAAATVETASATYAAQFRRGTNSAGTTILVDQARTDVNPFKFTYLGTQVGAITQNGTNAAYVTSSDGRRKPVEHRKPYDPGDIFDRIQIYDYQWDTGARGIGPVAQELHAIAPNLVVPGDDDDAKRLGDGGFEMWSTQVSEPLAMLMAEVKALRARMQDQEQELAALRNR